MISIITVEEKREFFCPQDEEEKKKRCLYLDDAESIEQEFRRIVEWHRGAFWDEMSLKLLKEIDGAVREESYGVETPIGKSCITCLSTGCKLGLVLWYYKNKDLRILTSFYRAGGNVWRFIAENFDISIFVLKSELESVLYSERDYSIVVDGRLYTEEDGRKLWELGIDAENEIYKITP